MIFLRCYKIRFTHLMFISENKFPERKTLLQNTKSNFGLKINSKAIDLGQGLNGIHYTFKQVRK